MNVYRRLTIVGAVPLLIALAACTPPAPSPSPTPTTATSTTPIGTATDGEHFASQGEKVVAQYPRAVPAGNFSGDTDETVTLSATDLNAPVEVVLLLTCTGTDTYSITVEQAHPNTVGAACGTAGTSIAAVPLDDPSQPTTLHIDIPDGSDYWLTTYYTRKDG
ncbi:hypothetical protein [Microbacterium sp. CSI-V]|uniref:hypothetical protein n=1 Tax=Microbacterium sp. CSI-V TaxID=1933777 RepID=UPI00136D1B6C|nr:hypothetical protein [Microbacterium sp. CSI-V]MXS74349.1 hypothetical protein [Microbacterium sp. TL13]